MVKKVTMYKDNEGKLHSSEELAEKGNSDSKTSFVHRKVRNRVSGILNPEFKLVFDNQVIDRIADAIVRDTIKWSLLINSLIPEFEKEYNEEYNIKFNKYV